MIGRYALPTDDLVWMEEPTITASAEDSDYPLTNWAGVPRPSKPSKLTTTTGWWEFDFGSAVSVAWFAALLHNFDEGVSVVLAWNSSSSWGSPAGSHSFTVPEWREDGAPGDFGVSVSPWDEIPGAPSYRYWRLEVGLTGPANSEALSLGRPAFLGALRDLGDPLDIEQDVRWGVVEEETQIIIDDQTEGGTDCIAEVFPPRRSFNGELALQDETAAALLALYRSAHRRVYPWYLIPDANVNEALPVRFIESRWGRTRETINHNIFAFRVQELARGIPWP
jgi:hypothetical protein